MTLQRPVPRLTRKIGSSGPPAPTAGCASCAATIARRPSIRRIRYAVTACRRNVTPQTVPGTGEIYSFTVNYQKWNPALEVPFVIARVAIDGAPGVLLTTNIVGCPVDSVDIGDRVRVTFERQGDIYYPLFEKIMKSDSAYITGSASPRVASG